MAAKIEAIQELAQALANQAQAIADGKIPTEQLYAQTCGMLNNAETLKAWVPRP